MSGTLYTRRTGVTNNRSYGSSGQNTTSHVNPDGSTSSSFGRGTPEAHGYNVMLSAAYKTAYDLFSPLSDKQWLTRLQAIASRPAVGSPSWTDSLGLTQDYDKRRIEAYNTAIADIYNLIDQYYSWRNTLPVTQVQQAADAGVNLAVSGGVNASDMPNVQSNLSNLDGSGTDTTSFASSAVSGIASFMSSVAGVYKSIQDIKLARSGQQIDSSKFLAGFWKSLSDSGFDVSGFQFNNWSDLSRFFSHSSKDPEQLRRVQDSLVKYIKSDYSNYPILTKFLDPDTGTYTGDDMVPHLMDIIGSDSLADFDRSMNLFANYELQTLLLDKLTSFNTAVYNENYSANLDGSAQALSENAVAALTSSSSSLDQLRNSVNQDFIQSFADQWHNTKSPESRFALLKMIANMNIDDQSAYELISILGSPTLAKGADKVISELISVGGDFAKKLSVLKFKKTK